MTAKPKTTAAPKSHLLKIEAKPDDSRDALIARVAAGPHFGNASIVTSYGKPGMGDISLAALLGVLKEEAGRIKNGDLGAAEATLSSQATALNVMFSELARRAALNMGEYIGAAETYLKLALRAQSQCRATLETLAAIKNPPVVFAKQANIANNQQVNNGEAVAVAPARETAKPQTELLEHDHGQRLDTRTAAAASGGNQAVETVATVHRAANGRRKVHNQS